MSDFTCSMAGLSLGNTLSPAGTSPTPACEPPPSVKLPPDSPTIIDEDGDLFIEVGPKNRPFQVDSRVLIRASKVWKAMLAGGWAESRPAEGAWVVKWPEADPSAIDTLLHIIHLNDNRHIPVDFPMDHLFQIAVAVDMYDLAPRLGLWARAWCKIALAALKDARECGELAKLTWIGWVFGSRPIFEGALQQVLLKLEVDGEGDLLDSEGVRLDDFEYFKAMDVLDHLSACRHQLITNLLSVVHGAILKGAAKTLPSYCRSNQVSSLSAEAARTKARADCNAVILGSLVQEFSARDLFPVPLGPEEIFESAPELRRRIADALAAVQTLGIPLGSAAGTAAGRAPTGHVDAAFHVGCKPSSKLLKNLDEAMSTASVEATPAHIRHLSMQAELIGDFRNGS